MEFMPRNVASFGGEIDHLTLLITIIGGSCLVLAEGFLLYSVLRFRKRDRGRPAYLTGNVWSQARWVLIPVAVVAALDFFIDVVNHHAWVATREQMPAQGMLVRVTGEQFLWTFTYPGPDETLDTPDDVHSPGALHVPVNTDVVYELVSRDMLHSLWVPALRLKQDAVPGRISRGWFRAVEPGAFDIACAEICGAGHSQMAARLVVHPEGEFQPWLDAQARNQIPADPAALLQTRGCLGCHSTDGTPRVGPSYRGLLGRQETVITEGQEREITVDEEYLRRSILEPKADLVKGFPPVMPEVKLTPAEVDTLVNYLKELK